MFRHYYIDHFPSLWGEFHALVADEEVISVREVLMEISKWDDILSEWAKKNVRFFQQPTEEETVLVTHIFHNQHFQKLVEKKKRIMDSPVADPFVIAKAKVKNGWVVTEEKMKQGRADIPNVCEELGVPCTNLEGFMKEKKWKF